MFSSPNSREESGAFPNPVLKPPDFPPRAAVKYIIRSSLKRYCGVRDHVKKSVLREMLPLTGAPSGLDEGVSTLDISDTPGSVTELLIDACFSSVCQRRLPVSDR